MSEPTIPIPVFSSAANKLAAKLMMVEGALGRIHDNLGGEALTPVTCAYIDGQLAKAIGWLASCRAIVVEEGMIVPAQFDRGDVVDLESRAGESGHAADATAVEGGAS